MFATILLEVGAQTCPFDRLRVPSWVEGLRPISANLRLDFRSSLDLI